MRDIEQTEANLSTSARVDCDIQLQNINYIPNPTEWPSTVSARSVRRSTATEVQPLPALTPLDPGAGDGDWDTHDEPGRETKEVVGQCASQ